MEQLDTVSFCWALSFCVPFWIVAFLCIRCRDGAPVRITTVFDDYVDSKPSSQSHNVSSFTVIRQPNYQTPVTPNLLMTPQPITNRRTSRQEMRDSDTDLYPNYENTDNKDSSDEDNGLKADSNYIEVIPDDVPTLGMSLRSTRGSRNDRNSSGTIGEDYENLKDEPLNDAQDGSCNYVNVEPLDEVVNRQSDEEDEEGSDYVNSSKCALRQ